MQLNVRDIKSRHDENENQRIMKQISRKLISLFRFKSDKKVLHPDFVNIKSRLKEALNSELPGERVHRLMLPQGRELYPATDNSVVIQSSVLIVLFHIKEGSILV